jgi:hypothetical protein
VRFRVSSLRYILIGEWWEVTEREEMSQTIGFSVSGGRGREFGADEGGQLVSTIRKGTWDWS